MRVKSWINHMRICGIVFLLLAVYTSRAHEIRPAYLQIKQVSDTSYDVYWKVPRLGDAFMRIKPVFSSVYQLDEAGAPQVISGAMLFHYRLHGIMPLGGQELSIENLDRTMTDALVDVEFLSGEKTSFMLRANHITDRIPAASNKWGVVKTYTRLGAEHIWTGIDHLMFVLALLLITRGLRKTIKTITAFTLAHSITLSLAALGLVQVPGPPVEATIALSIIFVALEIVKLERGQQSLTSRKPWLVAFSFGLLHGLGFAGALAAIGLPQTEIPLALAFFNLGVELGQIAFVLIISALVWVTHKSFRNWPTRTRLVPAYAIGSLAVFWMMERIAGFWKG
jgi:hydrogenase/urease accessory protein HupE